MKPSRMKSGGPKPQPRYFSGRLMRMHIYRESQGALRPRIINSTYKMMTSRGAGDGIAAIPESPQQGHGQPSAPTISLAGSNSVL